METNKSPRRQALCRWGFLSMLLVLFSARCAQAQSCPVVDLMPTYWKVVGTFRSLPDAERIRQFRAKLVSPHRELFGVDALGFASDEQLDKAIRLSIQQAQIQPASFREKEQSFRRQLPHLVKKFSTAVPEFRCDFTIYLLPSLGRLDGAGRKIDGVPALLFGVDLIASIHDSSEIPVFVDHELFHRYHFQASQMSDDDTERDQFWKALWVEGLATYASKTLNPKVAISTALMDPNLASAADRVLPSLISECEAEFDNKSHQAFSRFFLYHGAGAYPPSRSGYYIGFLAAQALGRTLTLRELAHLNASRAHDRLRKVLPSLSAESVHASTR